MKHFKRAAAMLLAVVLSLCLAVTAFAEGTDVPTGTLTVTGSGLYNPGDGAGKGKNVTAIRMFTARVTGNAAANPAQKNEFDSYVLEEKWEAFFKQDEVFTAMKNANIITSDADSSTITTEALSDAAVAYVKSLTNAEATNAGTLATFAHDAQKWARKNSDTLSAEPSLVTVKAATQDSDEDKTKGTATFTDLTAGYYLVFPEGGSTGKGNRGTDAILVNVPRDGKNTAVEIKSTFPTVDKQVSNDKTNYQDNTTAQVGDTVYFKLTAKVPDMTDYTTYKFIFHDTLSKGLAYDAGSVKVTIGGTEVTKGTDYTVTEPTEESKELTVTFADLTKVTGATAGKDIVVTYTAKITKDAVTTNPATNKVYLEYSNNPGTDKTGKSNPDESKVYTYQIDIDKYTGTYSASATRLAGATFELKAKKDATEPSIKLVKDSDNVYHIKDASELDTSAVNSVITDETGKITIKGLNAGTYYLYETIAPTGYNKLKEPIEIVITHDTNNLSEFTYKVNGTANTPNDTTIKVKNVKGVMLPETGSIGTIGLTVLGVAVVLLGVFAPRKKKKENR
jgi:fimbrial isopeptide formation D2 family protein/LPXTG-motif cell wall-anchored protein